MVSAASQQVKLDYVAGTRRVIRIISNSNAYGLTDIFSVVLALALGKRRGSCDAAVC